MINYISNLNPENPKIKDLENLIKSGVIIPDELKNNMKFGTTSLGGLFLEYYSNGHIKNVYRENSKANFSIYIGASGNFGQYNGDNITVKISHKSPIFKMTGIKKATTHDKIIIKLNKIIEANKNLLIESLEA